MHTDPIQDMIEAKGLNAPRVTPADIEAEIVSAYYFSAADGAGGAAEGYHHAVATSRRNVSPELHLVTFCVLVLRNGFIVTGESACVSPENFDAEIGRRIARCNAEAKIWTLLGFALRDAISEVKDDKRAPRYRCAGTGEYVTRGYAKANPTTTVEEKT